MKRTFITMALISLSSINMMAKSTCMPLCIEEGKVTSTTDVNDEWIDLGEITLIYTEWSQTRIKAQLYVREIANKLLYRIEYNGKFYAAQKYDFYKNPKDYCVTIDGKVYHFEVQIENNMTNSASSAGKTETNIFVGK